MSTRFTALDAIVLLAYLAGTTALVRPSSAQVSCRLAHPDLPFRNGAGAALA